MESMSDVCLRQLDGASYQAPNEDTDEYEYVIFPYRRPERKISNAHEDSAQVFLEFVQALRSSHIEHLELCSFIFTPEHAALVLQVPVVADTLSLIRGSCAELATTKLHKVFLHFSPTSLLLYSLFRACQITDELIRALFTNGVRFASFPKEVPVDGGRFCVTDDAIVELCVQQNIQNRQEEEGPVAKLELSLYNGSFTKDLFKRLVEASTASMRTQPLQIVVSPARVKDEDLRAFAQHLSYRYLDLQIVLHPDNSLEMIRARRGHASLKESDE
ncbi:hypothetical protein AAVH_30170 [Aphelenchoides avenae]|nr:hypothetical protein AAVH_30170 [Aphelenchus avenae]